TATQTDGAGNTSEPSDPTYFFTTDTTAAAPPTIGAPASGALFASDSVLISGTAEDGATVDLLIDGVPFSTTASPTTGVWSFTATVLARRSPFLTATQTDGAGNTSAASDPSYFFTTDTTAAA